MKPQMHWTDRMLIIAGVLFIALCVYGCVDSLPNAMGAETSNQRHIAHGYHEYKQFTQNN